MPDRRDIAADAVFRAPRGIASASPSTTTITTITGTTGGAGRGGETV